MTHHRPKSPSPARLPAVSDTAVNLEPVAEGAAGPNVPAPSVGATSPDQPQEREITSPMEIPQHLKVPGLNQGTTPGTPLAIAAPQLAKVAHSDLHKAHEPGPGELAPGAAGPRFDEMTLREPPSKKHDSGPRRAAPDAPKAEQPIGDVPTGPPRKSRIDVPAVADATIESPRSAGDAGGAPRKSRIDVPAPSFADATIESVRNPTDAVSAPRKSRTGPPVPAHDAPAISDTPTGPPRKSRVDVPALASDAPAISDTPTGPPRRSLTDVPVASPEGPKRRAELDLAASSEAHAGPQFDASHAAPARKSRADVPSQSGARARVASGEKPAAKASGSPRDLAPVRGNPSGPKGAADPTIERPGATTAPLAPVHEVETVLKPGEPQLTPEMMPGIPERPTVMQTLPAVPPVLPFGGVQDPRFKLGAMIAGVVLAVGAMGAVSWALLKHEPPMPPEDALKPAFVELPAPPRQPEPDDLPARAAAPKPMQLEVRLDGGQIALVPAGVLKIFTEPECNVFVDGRDLGPTPATAQLPAGKVNLTMVNTKLGLHVVETVEVKANELKNAEFTFAPGFLEVVADDDARLTVDGRQVKPGSMQVWQGTHRVEAIYGNEKVARSAQVLAGATTTVELHSP